MKILPSSSLEPPGPSKIFFCFFSPILGNISHLRQNELCEILSPPFLVKNPPHIDSSQTKYKIDILPLTLGSLLILPTWVLAPPTTHFWPPAWPFPCSLHNHSLLSLPGYNFWYTVETAKSGTAIIGKLQNPVTANQLLIPLPFTDGVCSLYFDFR